MYCRILDSDNNTESKILIKPISIWLDLIESVLICWEKEI